MVAASGVACIIGDVGTSDGESTDGSGLRATKGFCCGVECAAGRRDVVHQQEMLAGEAARAGWRHKLERAMHDFTSVCR
jgi:hypothetical protein